MKRIPDYINVQESLAGKAQELRTRLRKIEREEDIKFPASEINSRLAELLPRRITWMDYVLYGPIASLVIMVVILSL